MVRNKLNQPETKLVEVIAREYESGKSTYDIYIGKELYSGGIGVDMLAEVLYRIGKHITRIHNGMEKVLS